MTPAEAIREFIKQRREIANACYEASGPDAIHVARCTYEGDRQLTDDTKLKLIERLLEAVEVSVEYSDRDSVHGYLVRTLDDCQKILEGK